MPIRPISLAARRGLVRLDLFTIFSRLYPAPTAYLHMLQRAQAFSATIFGDDMKAMKLLLEQSNAFKGHEEAGLKVVEE